jgi:hypothetical protein
MRHSAPLVNAAITGGRRGLPSMREDEHAIFVFIESILVFVNDLY